MDALWDYENGATLAQLIHLNVEAGRLSLIREKREVNAMVVALASIFDGKALERYNAETDRILSGEAFNDKPPIVAKPVRTAGMTKDEVKQAATTTRTMRELNKLNTLLRRK